MKLVVKTVLVVVAALLSLALPAQELPKLATDPNISVGALPCGLKYYVVKNTAAPGYADYSLVQKGEVPVEQSRKALLSLPHFRDVLPYKFLTRRGVGYKQWGYIDHSHNATFYRFEDLPTSDLAVSDSTLMMLFDLCQEYPYEQAIIISGDINPATIIDRMGVFSLMVSPHQPYPGATKTDDLVASGLQVETVLNPEAAPAKVTLNIKAPRTPAKLLGTVQPHMTKMLAYELGFIMQGRLSRALKQENIPFARIDFDFRGSAASPKEDCFMMDIYVNDSYLSRTTALLSQTLATIDEYGISVEELGFAKQKALDANPETKVDAPVSNAEYLERCAAAYLYGASLASNKVIRSFFTGKTLSVETETNLFNSFAKALIDRDSNISLRYETSLEGLKSSILESIFRSEWHTAEMDFASVTYQFSDTNRFRAPVAKVKLKTAVAEPATGGKLMTFSNGIKVIYKNIPGSGRFDYALALRGGYASIPTLGDGQGAYVADLLDLCKVSGLSGDAFRELLCSCGVQMDNQVGCSDMRIGGSAPKSQLSLVINALTAMACKRDIDRDAFSYYMLCERERVSLAQRENQGYLAMADSIMRPGYKFSPHKYMYGLNEGMHAKANAFFDSQFAKINDGYFFFMGDISEAELLSALTRCLGNFSCGKEFSAKPLIQYQMIAGDTSILDENEGGRWRQLNISLSNMAPVSADRYMSFLIAQMALQKGLSRALGSTGLYAEVSGGFEIFPMERLSVDIVCRPADIDGLPAGVDPQERWSVLKEARKAVVDVCATPVSAADLAIYKKLLSAQMAGRVASPEGLMDLAILRYSFNRDFLTNYAAKINAVTAQSVQEVLKTLSEGAKVEYTISE